MENAVRNHTKEEGKLFSNHAIKRLVIPLIIEQILAVAVGMADVMMISVAGEAAVSGVSLVDMINVLILNVFAALATGGAVVSAQLLGKKAPQKACESAHQLLSITLIISLAILVAVMLCREGLLRLLFGGIDDAVMRNCMIYLTITSISYPFIAIYNSGAALFRSMGNSRVSMMISILMNCINISGNALCVFVLNMGIAGVAIPSVVSRAVAAFIVLVLLYNKNNQIHLFRKVKYFKLQKEAVKQILHIGIPNGLENGLFHLGRALVVSIIAGFGTVQIAANAVANNIDSMGCIPGQALSLAMITVVGQCVGAGDYNQAKYYIKKLLKMNYIIAAAVNGLILLLLPLILQAYGSLSPETIRLSTILIFIHNGCAIFLWPLSFTLPNALRAANDVGFTMLVSICSMWLFRIAGSYLVCRWYGWGAIGVWIFMVVDWICRIAFFIWRYKSGKWKKYNFAAI